MSIATPEMSVPLLPGGVNRSTLVSGPNPAVALRGSGYMLSERGGRELIDLSNNYTSLIHGHAHPAIVEAGREALARGACYGFPNRHEHEHAQRLIARLPWMEQVRHTCSGTEAVMAAVRIARAHTAREKIVLVEAAYHGTADAVLPAGGEHFIRGVTAGVQRDALVVPLNDVAALERAVESHPGQIAAILLDMLPNRSGLVPLSDDFLVRARELGREHGALLVADEVVGFRLGFGGISEVRDFRPDLLVLGKMIGGGLPIGAVVGRQDVMSEIDPTRPNALLHGGTFVGNPVSMACGVVALDLFDEAAVDRLNALGDRARERLAGLASERWDVRGQGSLLRLYPADPSADVRAMGRALWEAAHARGLLIMETGFMALSTPLTEDVVDDAMRILADAAAEVDAAA